MTRRQLKRFARQRRLVKRYKNHEPPRRMRAQVWNACDALDAYWRKLPGRLDTFFRRAYPTVDEELFRPSPLLALMGR